jgi:hypothetical protein
LAAIYPGTAQNSAIKAGSPRQTNGRSQTNISGPAKRAEPSQYKEVEKYPHAPHQRKRALLRGDCAVQAALKGRAKAHKAAINPAGGSAKLVRPPDTNDSKNIIG